MICECDVSNVDYGIRCVQSARVGVTNKVSHRVTNNVIVLVLGRIGASYSVGFGGLRGGVG